MTRFGMFGVAFLAASSAAFALPKATELVDQMGFGINIGNTMEVPISSSCANMSCWGNELPTKTYVDAIKAAGFNSVRIPCAWYTHTTDKDSMTIASTWMDSVKTVVDYVIDNGMYAFLNAHWDAGWAEDNVFSGEHYGRDGKPTTTDSSKVRARQRSYWTQIATFFKDYDEHLLFGSANEPGVNDPWLESGQVVFDENRMKILNDYHEDMMKAVRSAGGNNGTRTIVVQAPRTDEALALSLMKDNMPTDPAGAGYVMMEFHFYPYQWSLMTNDEDWGNCFYYWGEENYSTTDKEHNANYSKSAKSTVTGQYAGEAYTDSVFKALKEGFVDRGYPVVIGEYAVIRRMHLTGDNLRKHLNSRVAWYKRVNELSKQYGFIPFAWDTGSEGLNDNTIVYRQNGHTGIREPEVLDAMREAYGLAPLGGKSIDSLVAWSEDNANRSIDITYQTVTSDSSEVGTMRMNVGKSWSSYTAISLVMSVDITSGGPATGETYGWSSISLFAMSGNDWAWSEYNFDESDIDAGWKEYKVSLNANGLDLANKASVNAVGLNVYGTQLTGEIIIDEIRLYKADGSYDVFEDFNKSEPDLEGIATGKLIDTPANAVSPIECFRATLANKMLVNLQHGKVLAQYNAATATPARATLMNAMGQVIAQKVFNAKAGANRVELSSDYRGPAMLVVKQGSQRYMQKVILR